MNTPSHRAPVVTASLLALILAATLPLVAQLTAQTDPANLAGERVSAPSLADTLPIDHGALALQQLLRKLSTRASFMLIVAHPDDEDGGLLTYLSRGKGARVAMLTLNRGEGGQNMMSGDFEDALGLLRTQELLVSDRYIDADQLFGTEVDFGFSKTKEESFAKWTHERVLYDAVRAVRLYRPLVIASVFIGAPSDGHGQHQVSGEIAQEVFNAAGDPDVFPDQIAAGLQPWQPLKVYARVPFARIDAHGMFDYATEQYTPARFTNYVTGNVTTTIPRANVIIPEGTPDTLLGGLSYAQFAAIGRALQKTQFGPTPRPASPGPHNVAYHRYGSRLNQPDGDNDTTLESSLFSGIDTSIEGIATLAPDAPILITDSLRSISGDIASAQTHFDPVHMERSAPALRTALDTVDDLIRNIEPMSMLAPQQRFNLLHELRIKRVQLNAALLLADGVTLTAKLSPQGALDSLLTTAKRIDINTTLTASAASVELHSIDLQFLGRATTGNPHSIHANLPIQLNPRSIHRQPLSVIVNKQLPETRPYFSRPNIEQPVYDISNPALRNAPATPAPLTVVATLTDHGVPLTIEATVAAASDSSPIQPAVVVPPVSVSLPVTAAVIPIQTHAFSIAYSAFNPQPQFAPQFRLELPSLWTYTVPPALNPLPGVPPDGRVSRQTAVVNTFEPGPYVSYPITIVTSIQGHDYREGYRSVGYPGLEHTNFFSPTVFHVAAVDLAVAPHLNVAYVAGTGDAVPDALQDLGIHPHILAATDLTAESLHSYDAVILGVRAYEHPEIAAANPALNAYAAAGGTVIVQYNTGRLPANTGPYPLNLGDSEKVVEENARVRILDPAAPILSWPNQITPADFEHWIEERGHGFMATWDPRYRALLETHDAGQQPQRGGLLVAHTGHGAWIYLGLALYRQLPEGVPGAYRLLANLISATKNPAFQSSRAVNTH